MMIDKHEVQSSGLPKGPNVSLRINTGQTEGLIRREWKDIYAFVVDGRAPDHWYDIVFGSGDDLGSVTKSKAEFIQK